ncbi:hypothetical protein MAALD49_00570 [Marinobacter shengliensis]|nr:hypothetical protein MAALD49_00570 [Marinobacter shengliensis]
MVLCIVTVRKIHAGSDGNNQNMRVEGTILLIYFCDYRVGPEATGHRNHGIGNRRIAANKPDGH